MLTRPEEQSLPGSTVDRGSFRNHHTWNMSNTYIFPIGHVTKGWHFKTWPLSVRFFSRLLSGPRFFRSLPVLALSVWWSAERAVLRSPNMSHLPVQWDDEPRVTWLRPRLAALCLYQVFLIVQMVMKDARWLMPVTYCTCFTPPPPPLLTLYILSSVLPPPASDAKPNNPVFFFSEEGRQNGETVQHFDSFCHLNWSDRLPHRRI